MPLSARFTPPRRSAHCSGRPVRRPVLASAPPCQRSGPQSSRACRAGAGDVSVSAPADSCSGPRAAATPCSVKAWGLASRHAPAPRAGSRTWACSCRTCTCQPDAASVALGVVRASSAAACSSSWRGPWCSAPRRAAWAWASRPSSVSSAPCSCQGAASCARWACRLGALRRACSSGSCQPPRQRACSVALPWACRPASGGAAPGRVCAQARVRAASLTSSRAWPWPRVASSSPCTRACRPGASRVRSALPPGA